MAETRGLDIDPPISIPEFIRRFGCMSNPKAREYLNADIIKELERMEAKTGSLSRAAAYGQAIALIRDGVKKE
jgi:hypothetical protein